MIEGVPAGGLADPAVQSVIGIGCDDGMCRALHLGQMVPGIVGIGVALAAVDMRDCVTPLLSMEVKLPTPSMEFP